LSSYRTFIDLLHSRTIQFFRLINKWIYILFGLLILFTITSIVLAAAILGVVVNRLESKNTIFINKSEPISLVDQIKIDDLMKHLEELQVFADRSNGTRAIGTSGFNDTLDYITDQLKQNTNLIIQHQYFTVRNYIVQGTPQLQTEINGNITNHVYLTDFTQILFSSRADFVSFVPVVAIPNLGCSDADWTNVLATSAIALVMRGGCPYIEKSKLAEKYQVRGLLIYNDGLRSDNLQPIQGVKNNLNTRIPAYFLSYDLGKQLANAGANPRVMMNIDVADVEGVANICADTPSGDQTKTIVVGAHSDGVQAGSGINDNGKKTSIC
jgi:hypothetical protein